jgi:hypothetical protein
MDRVKGTMPMLSKRKTPADQDRGMQVDGIRRGTSLGVNLGSHEMQARRLAYTSAFFEHCKRPAYNSCPGGRWRGGGSMCADRIEACYPMTYQHKDHTALNRRVA